MMLVELPLMVNDCEVPETMWVCVDGQACMLARTFPDLARW